MKRTTAGAILGLLLAAPAAADAPRLALPIDCTLGTTCYIEDYVDILPGDGQRDYTCGLKTREGHRGTDIVLRSFDMLEDGVDVLAAAPGTVAATRDGMADRAVTPENRAEIEGRECGNAVRVDHGGGWQTLYCHMKRGSIAVKSGDVMQAGDRLGHVGLSGLTNIPHIHISVLKDGQIVDPFLPDSVGGSCGATAGNGLWIAAPPYNRAGLFTAGFSKGVPSFDAVKSGAARVAQITPDAPLVVYGFAFYPEPGDLLTLWAEGPDGEMFRTEITLDDPQIQLFRAYGRKAPAGGWPPGDYRGYVEFTRDGRLIAIRHADVTVRAP